MNLNSALPVAATLDMSVGEITGAGKFDMAMLGGYTIPPPGGGVPTPYNGPPLPPPVVPPKTQVPSSTTDDVTKDSSKATTPDGTENVEGVTTGSGIKQLWDPAGWPWWAWLLIAAGAVGIGVLIWYLVERSKHPVDRRR